MDRLLVQAGAHLALVWAGLEESALLYDLASVVYAGPGEVVNGAGVGASSLGRAAKTLLQQEGGGAQQ